MPSPPRPLHPDRDTPHLHPITLLVRFLPLHSHRDPLHRQAILPQQ
jgi:hypothetical protein